MRLRPVLSPARRRRRRIVWITLRVLVGAAWSWSLQSDVLWIGTHLGLQSFYGRGTAYWWQSREIPVSGSPIKIDIVPFIQIKKIAHPRPNKLVEAAWQSMYAPTLGSFGNGAGSCDVPLGIFLLFAIAFAARVWFAMALSPSTCSRCGYDLAGLARASHCPECGSVAIKTERVAP